jgi:hypothetical protein
MRAYFAPESFSHESITGCAGLDVIEKIPKASNADKIVRLGLVVIFMGTV